MLNNEDHEWHEVCAEEEDEDSSEVYFDDSDTSFDDTMITSELPLCSRSERVARIRKNSARYAAEKANDFNKNHAEQVSKRVNFDLSYVEDDESEPIASEQSSAESFEDYYSDIPLPEDSDAPPEHQKRIKSYKASEKSESKPIVSEHGSSKCLTITTYMQVTTI